MSNHCKILAGHNGPLDDEIVMRAFDQAYDSTWKKLGLEEPEGMIAIFGAPEMLKDPLLLRIDLEALDGKGPRALNPAALRDAALELDDSYALWAAAQLLDGDDADALRRGLEEPKHIRVAKQLDFLQTYFGEDEYKNAPPEYLETLRTLAKSEPENGLWLVLQIAHREPSDRESVKRPPLTSEELALAERAFRCKRFSMPQVTLVDAVYRLAGQVRFPYRDSLYQGPAPFFNLHGFLRHVVVKRGQSLVDEASAANDDELVRRTIAVIRAMAERMSPGQSGLRSAIATMLQRSYRRRAAELELKHRRLGPQEWIASQKTRVFAHGRSRLSHQGFKPIQVGLALSNSRLAAATSELMDGEWIPWEIHRALECANRPKAIAVESRYVESMKERAMATFNDVVSIGILEQRAVAPALRGLVPLARDDDILWALVWTTGRLKDRAQIPWLIKCLDDPRPWLPLAAAEALRDITDKDHGTDPAAWRNATKSP